MSEMEEAKKITFKVPKMGLWFFTTLVLAVILIAIMAITFINPSVFLNLTGRATGVTANAITSADAGKKTVDYINNNLVQTGVATLTSVKEFDGLYEVTVLYQNQSIPVYMTKDGTYLFASQPFDTSKTVSNANTQNTQQDIPKGATSEADLFVMGFCPYGVQAETIMKPVFDLLGSKAKINVKFIVTVQGTTPDSVQSLHGATEAQEDLRQVCIMKYYDQKTYWNYLTEFDNNCPNVRTDATALDTCWKSAATKAGIDTSKIETCSNSTEAVNLLKADEQLASQYGVSGSPTLIINGVTYNGARSAEAYKQGICSGFTNQPSECSQNLTSSGSSTASGGCG